MTDNAENAPRVATITLNKAECRLLIGAVGIAMGMIASTGQDRNAVIALGMHLLLDAADAGGKDGVEHLLAKLEEAGDHLHGVEGKDEGVFKRRGQ